MLPTQVYIGGVAGMGTKRANAAVIFGNRRWVGSREDMDAKLKTLISPTQDLNMRSSSPAPNLDGKYNSICHQDGILIPGLKDSHAHPVLYSIIGSLDPIYIFGLKNKHEILDKIRKEIDTRKEKGIIFAYGLNTTLIKDLNSQDLNLIESELPVIIFDPSYHGAIANSKALSVINQLAIKKKKELGRELAGQMLPNGKLSEEYVFLAFELMDSVFGKDISEAAKNESKHIISYLENMLKRGVTSCNDMLISTPTQVYALLLANLEWKDLKNSKFPVDKIYLRPDLFLLFSKNKQTYGEIISKLNPWINENKVGLKLFSDGSFGSYTANLSENYSNANTNGIAFDSRALYTDAFNLIKQLGIKDVRIHAIGDRGILHALNMIRIARSVIGRDLNAGIEHFELSGYSNIIQIAKQMGIKVCIQPNFNSDIYDYRDRLGERISQINPLKSISNLEIPMTFGTDGMPDSMLFALFSAINHPNPKQALSFEESLIFSSDPDPSNLIIISNNAFKSLQRMPDQEQIKIAFKRSDEIAAALNQSVLKTIIGGILASS
jgi:predicted amidohydrolase YtcJ